MTNIHSIWLDYDGVSGKKKLLRNLSAVAADGDLLWTASDEGRTVECLALEGDRYSLRRQYEIDALFGRLPGAATGDEADIESIDAYRGCLWICGSHCKVRAK